MKRLVGFALIAGLLTATGCFTAALPESVVPKTSPPVSKSLPPVTASQFTGTNGQEMLQGVEGEITRDEQEMLLSPSSR